jgi:hypothetical protein
LSLWTVDASGQFQETVPFTGFPGGKPKTIIVPLDGVFATQDHRIRLVHSSQIYWDQIRLGYGQSTPIKTAQTGNLSMNWLPMESAELHYRGFSRELPRARHEPHWYDYQSVSIDPAWPPLRGKFTRYGNAKNLVEFDDDALVVMSPGDELLIRFQIPSDPLPEGWVRDFVLHSVGWDKDAAMNTLEGQSSLPLPFSKMSQYPPGMDDRAEAQRIDRLHQKTLNRKQDAERFWKFAPVRSTSQ